MEITALTPKFYKQWDDFCLQSDEVWFWHTSCWLRYILNYKPDLKPESKSFMIIKDKKIAAICPLVLENHQGVKEFSFGDDYCPAPALANFLTPREKQKITKLVFEQIDELAKENGIKRARFRISVLGKGATETENQKFNFLMKFGYLDNSLNTQVLDLRKPLEELRLQVRHGHDSDIDRAAKTLKTEIFDQKNITEKIFKEYVDLHQQAAGRKTRPQATFDLMLEYIKNGNGFLVGAKKDKSFVGFSFFSMYKNNVYYGSSANDRELEKTLPISHLIQWAAIEWMNKKEIQFYEFGWQRYAPTLSNFPNAKEINISKFQRGFGGFTLPIFRGEKYYDKDYFLKTYQERIKKYGDLIK